MEEILHQLRLVVYPIFSRHLILFGNKLFLLSQNLISCVSVKRFGCKLPQETSLTESVSISGQDKKGINGRVKILR